MKVNHWGRARQFIKAHAIAAAPLAAWKKAVIEAEWENFSDVKETFNTADWVEGLIVFDIGGNKFRLVAVCRFELDTLYIQDVMTHEEYDKSKWKAQSKKTKKAK